MARAILPGQSSTLQRGRIEAHFRAIAKKHTIRVTSVVQDVAEKVVRDLEQLTPKDTGAAAGTIVGARRKLYAWHPAARLNLTIGHEPGQSGWQAINIKDAKQVYIKNPMWDEYLKNVNYMYDNFVETAARQMREYIKYLLSERA